MLLLAAAATTGLTAALTNAVAAVTPVNPHLARLRSPTLHSLLATLLFLPVAGLHRPHDLRSYSGDALALLTGRRRAYGYRFVERFLALLAQAGAAQPLTAALASWTAALWLPKQDGGSSIVYIDGHRKPLYSDYCIPRGLIGRTGKILGCRALTLLHDAVGHVLLASTSRGDQHLTLGAPAIIAAYEAANPAQRLTTCVIDREGMSAGWLAQMLAQNRQVITLLRRDQYGGLDSFTQVGDFKPLLRDRAGQVLREVALANFMLRLPEQEHGLPLSVALIRDHSWQEPVATPALMAAARWSADLRGEESRWWDDEWQAPPSPAKPTQPHLIPIVSTASCQDALELARRYTHRWAAQENIIRDWLLPLGLDHNHGYGKTAVLNSEVEKKRRPLQQRLARLQRWADRTRQGREAARERSEQLQRKVAHREREWDRKLARREAALARAQLPPEQVRQRLSIAEVRADKELIGLMTRQMQSEQRAASLEQELAGYCRKQREVARQLADLGASEQQMYELDNRKDQVMTVLKVGLANLGMYVRDQWFPASYAQATWRRLLPFFALRGRVRAEGQWVTVTLHPFNDRRLNRDLGEVCRLVAAKDTRLPDGRRLIFTMAQYCRPISDA